jgi:hypothetical protein
MLPTVNTGNRVTQRTLREIEKLPRLLLCVAFVLIPPAHAHAQAIPRVAPGWGVDTTAAAWSDIAWHAAVPEIYRAWRDYLLADPHLQSPTRLWSAREQRAWPAYDLTAGIAYKGMPATVLDIRPVEPGRLDEYVVKTLFAQASGEARTVRPVALTRVYALRGDGRWVFANALPRMTREWQRETVGPVTYVIEPGRRFDRRRAQRAVAFADSLAQSLGVPPLEDVTYYVARSPESLHRAMGIDWTFGAQGHGYALPSNQLILSGDATFGEENRHELAHYVLMPILAERRTHGIVNEGIATWLGGSVGRTFPELHAEYAAYLRDHPDITLDAILDGDAPDRGWYPAGAVLVMLVHERGGIAAVRELLTSGRSHDELRSATARLLDMPWSEVTNRWRARALAGR